MVTGAARHGGSARQNLRLKHRTRGVQRNPADGGTSGGCIGGHALGLTRATYRRRDRLDVLEMVMIEVNH